MTVRRFLTLPNPVLRTRAIEVEDITSDTRQLVSDMLETMYMAGGIGLAASQIGVLQRIVVIDISNGVDAPRPLVLINPAVIAESIHLNAVREICSCVPGFTAVIERPMDVTVQYLDLDGTLSVLEAEGIMATCVQHEIDHLNGVLFTDYLMPSSFDAFNRANSHVA